jgi:HK97 family phage major capsid protein
MNLEQLKARLAEIVGLLDGLKSVEGSYTEEQVEQVNALSEEFEKIQKQIETAERIAALTQKATTSERKVVTPAAKIEVGQNRQALDPKGGFSTAGEFFLAVKNASKGIVDKKLIIHAGAQEKSNEDGAYLIPSDFRQEIQKVVMGDESLLPRTKQFTTSSNNLSLPVNETNAWDGSGVQAYWEGEASTLTDSKPKFGESNWRLHKLTALVRVTDELIEDAPALESWIKSEAPAAMLHKVNSAILHGNGAGMPQGLLNSPFKYKVAKESGQAADTIMFENINNMLGRILPESFAKSVWICNPAVLPQLRLMKFDSVAASPVPVYMPPSGVAEAPFGTLYGRPILSLMAGTKALGDEGDIMLVDLSKYYSVVKTAGIKADVSTHVYFLSQEQAFRFSMRIAGHCPFKAPVSTENGAFQMSGFVTLEDR